MLEVVTPRESSPATFHTANSVPVHEISACLLAASSLSDSKQLEAHSLEFMDPDIDSILYINVCMKWCMCSQCS